MKKQLFTMLLCVGSLAAVAQTNQGTISLGGAVGFSTETQKDVEGDYKINRLTFAPSAGYFLADGMELGLALSLSHTNYTSDGEDAGNSNATALGPFFKYYMFTSNEKFAFTVNASLLFGFGKDRNSEGDVTSRTSDITFALSPGFTYFFTNKVGLDFQLRGISFQREDPNTDVDDNESTTFTFGVNSFEPTLGFRYFFAR